MKAPMITPADALAAALRGAPCSVHGLDGGPQPVPAVRWRLDADAADRALLARCHGATVDIGCGPGRMTSALLTQGVKAMGIDVVAEAVRQARQRGAPALQRDVFGRLPGEGRWDTALLADGNIGIGGDPVRLLRRVREVIAADGRVVIDLAEPGGPIRVHRIGLEVDGRRSWAFPWALVPADQIELLAEAASLRVLELTDHCGRWFAALSKDN
jgi:SAM-dependent methyltransferase